MWGTSARTLEFPTRERDKKGRSGEGDSSEGQNRMTKLVLERFLRLEWDIHVEISRSCMLVIAEAVSVKRLVKGQANWTAQRAGGGNRKG